MNSQQDVFKLTQSYLYYNSNAAIDKEFNYTPAFSKTKDTVVEGSEIVRIIIKEGYTIVRTEELEKLKKTKSALKALCGISRALENKLKTLSNDIRTISES